MKRMHALYTPAQPVSAPPSCQQSSILSTAFRKLTNPADLILHWTVASIRKTKAIEQSISEKLTARATSQEISRLLGTE
jgi:hypothetical protein